MFLKFMPWLSRRYTYSLQYQMCSIEILVIVNYPAITNIFAINQIIRYNGVLAITKTPLQRTFFSVPWHLVIAGCHCKLFFYTSLEIIPILFTHMFSMSNWKPLKTAGFWQTSKRINPSTNIFSAGMRCFTVH